MYRYYELSLKDKVAKADSLKELAGTKKVVTTLKTEIVLGDVVFEKGDRVVIQVEQNGAIYMFPCDSFNEFNSHNCYSVTYYGTEKKELKRAGAIKCHKVTSIYQFADTFDIDYEASTKLNEIMEKAKTHADTAHVNVNRTLDSSKLYDGGAWYTSEVVEILGKLTLVFFPITVLFALLLSSIEIMAATLLEIIVFAGAAIRTKHVYKLIETRKKDIYNDLEAYLDRAGSEARSIVGNRSISVIHREPVLDTFGEKLN